MSELVVENILAGGALRLAVGSAKFSAAAGLLTIRVDFPAADAAGAPAGQLPDPWRATDAFLEVEIPLPNESTTYLGNTFALGPAEEDWTNFYVADTHYPTFDDKICISLTAGAYLLRWSGFVPDINHAEYADYMQRQFPFALETACQRR
jgi:hypothetical protein